MKRRLPKTIIIALFTLSAAAMALLAVDYAILRQANRLYAEGRYDGAAQRYNNRLIRYLHPDTFSLNIGAALYKQEEYQKAGEFFGKRLADGMASLAAPLNYNIGNCRYRQGRQSEKVNPANAVSLYREALAYYQKSLQFNPVAPDARYNLSLTEARLRGIADQAGKKEGEGKAANETKRGDESSQHRPAGDRRDRESERQGQDKAAAENNRRSGEDKKEADRRTAPSQLKVKKGDMSRKEAEMLLEEYRQMEENQGQPGGKMPPGQHPDAVKGW